MYGEPEMDDRRVAPSLARAHCDGDAHESDRTHYCVRDTGDGTAWAHSLPFELFVALGSLLVAPFAGIPRAPYSPLHGYRPASGNYCTQARDGPWPWRELLRPHIRFIAALFLYKGLAHRVLNSSSLILILFSANTRPHE